MVVGRKRRRETQENNTGERKVLSMCRVKAYICKEYKLRIIMLKIQNIVESLA